MRCRIAYQMPGKRQQSMGYWQRKGTVSAGIKQNILLERRATSPGQNPLLVRITNNNVYSLRTITFASNGKPVFTITKPFKFLSLNLYQYNVLTNI
jgi:hypothetical protein